MCAETECTFFDKTYILKYILNNIKNFSSSSITKIINSEFFIVTGSSKFNNENLKNLFHWDTYWFHKTVKDIKVKKEEKYKYHFICLNGRIRPHRANLIDHLYKENLFKNGCISWLNFKRNITEEDSYKFKYWTPKNMYIDVNDELLAGASGDFISLMQCITKNTNSGLQYNPPIEYYRSFMQIVTETHIQKHFITEKTVTPLILAKPFLVLSSPNFHSVLTNYGFKLYDEIFDYSFDKEQSLDKRITGIIINLKKTTALNFNQCRKLYVKILDKLIYNKELAFKIANDKSLIPKIYSERKLIGGPNDYS